MKREELIKGRWYRGLDRFVGRIALWTGAHFVGFQIKFGQYLETAQDFDEDMDIKLLEGLK